MEPHSSSEKNEEQLTPVQFVSVLVHDVFFISLCVYVISVLVESIRRGIIVSVINLNLVLLICLISGFLTTFFPETYVYKKRSFWYGALPLFAGVATGFFIDQSLRDASSYHLLFALAGGVLVSLLGFSILFPFKSPSNN